MNLMSWLLPTLYYVFVFGVCTYLLIRGVTHLFVSLFAAGALLGIFRMLGWIALEQAPGGIGENMRYMPVLTLIGSLGMLVSVAAFFSLAAFLLRNERTAPPQV